MPSTIGTAPRRPAQPSSARSRAREVAQRRRDPDGGGTDHEHEQRGEREPGSATAGRSLGNTSRPSTTNIVTCARNASPSWNATSWRAVARRRAADGEPDEVDGEEAAAADHVGDAERERGRPRPTRPGANAPIECGRRENAHIAAAPSTTPTSEAEAELPDHEQREIRET